MIRNLKLAKVFWIITTLLASLAALGGLLFRDIYVDVCPRDYLPGAPFQDVLTLIVCALVFVLIFVTKQNEIKKQVVIIGLLGALFYLYGVFAIERVYNWCYLLYVGTFASSFWSIVYSLAGFKSEALSRLRLNGAMLKTTAISSLAIAVVFTVLWTVMLIPLMRDHNRIEYLYSVFILDLCFIMPAFFVTAVMSLRRMPFGVLMGPAMMILGFFVIFPLGLCEAAKPLAGMAVNYGAMVASFLFALYMLAIAVLQLRMIRLQ